jgi:hypothetical protein
MANPQQFDRVCRVVALLIRRLLETEDGAAANRESSPGAAARTPQDARESASCQVEDPSQIEDTSPGSPPEEEGGAE